MKKSLILSLALAILVPAVSLAQKAPKLAAQKPRTIAGLVSADAKTFVDAKNAQWTVINSGVLSGFASQRVKVKYLLASGQNQVQILSVKLAEPLIQNTAFKTDSAFRR